MDRRLGVCYLAGLVTLRLMTFSVVLSQSCAPDQNDKGRGLVPFGDVCRDEVLPTQFDDTSEEIDLPSDFRFFTKKYSSVFINSNGVVSFVSPQTDFVKDPPDFPIAGLPLIAPYWADVDTRQNNGSVYYRLVDTENNTDVLRNIGRKFLSGQDYTPVWGVIVTWSNVTHYGGNSTTPANTFQAVLTTDGARSYVQFFYDQILWSSHDASSVAAQVGFNAGVGRRSFSLPLSRDPAVVDIDTETNCETPGVFAYQVDGTVISPHLCNPDAEISISPPYGTPLGGQQVHIAGPCFDDMDNIKVRFDGQERPLAFITNNYASFITPMSLRLGTVLVQLSTDGGANYIRQTTFSLVNTDAGVQRLDSTSWDTQTTEVGVQWDSSLIDADSVDIFFLTFNLTYNDSDTRVPEAVYVPLVVDTPNDGMAAIGLEAGLPLASDQQLMFATFGSIAIAPNGTLSSTILYSDVHLSRWYVHLVVCETTRRAVASLTSPTSALLTDLFNGTEVNCSAIDEAALAMLLEDVAAAQCDAWAVSEPDPSETVGPVPSPPCREGQAAVDPSWVRDGQCFITRLPTPAGNGQTACYGQDKDLSNDNMLNRAQLAHPSGATSGSGSTLSVIRLWKVSNFKRDREPKFVCCVLSDKCDLYLQRRPTQDCVDYKIPAVAGTFGFTHFVTYDQKEFTFNDVGEYIVSADTSSGFNLQGRMVEASVRLTGGETRNVSRWGAFVSKTDDSDTVEVRIDEGFLEIAVNGEEFYIDELTPELPLRGVTFSRKGRAICLYYDTGNSVEVTYTEDGLSLLAQAPADQRVMLEGLFGMWNTTRAGPYVSRDGEAIPADSTVQAIRSDFGLTWRTTSNESLFAYPEGTGHRDFQDLDFIPYFAPADMTRNAFCDGSFQCNFDYGVTADMVTAVTSRDFRFRIRDIYGALTEMLSRCDDRPCGNGTCVVRGASVHCECDDGYDGDDCEILVGTGAGGGNQIIIIILAGVLSGVLLTGVLIVTTLLCRSRPSSHTPFKEEQFFSDSPHHNAAADVPSGLFSGAPVRRHDAFGSRMFRLPTRPDLRPDPRPDPRPDLRPDPRPDPRLDSRTATATTAGAPTYPDLQSNLGPDATSGYYDSMLPPQRSDRQPTPDLPQRNYSTFRQHITPTSEDPTFAQYENNDVGGPDLTALDTDIDRDNDLWPAEDYSAQEPTDGSENWLLAA